VAGRLLQGLGLIVGDGPSSGSSRKGGGADAAVAVGVLARTASELIGTSGSLLAGKGHYAGAALLRQIVEIEYLTWAFANEERDAAAWLRSTHEQRRELFQPAHLRRSSGGRFNDLDYRHHCELGGHPVPRGLHLIGGSDEADAQLLLVDLLLHSWRITDNLRKWASGRRWIPREVIGSLHTVQQSLASWGELDPLYAWACSEMPARQDDS